MCTDEEKKHGIKHRVYPEEKPPPVDTDPLKNNIGKLIRIKYTIK